MADRFDPAFRLIKKYEGCKLHAYQDVVGVWTIGWGSTLGVHPGMTITQEQADQMCLDDVKERSFAILKMVTVNINDNQLCALISFAYNVGLGALHHSHLLTYLNEGASKLKVAAEFLKWDHAGGKVFAGLTRRRHEEAELFLA